MENIRPTVLLAYNKLKNYVYYDNFNTHLRARLAQFDNKASFDQKIDELAASLNNYISTKECDDYLTTLLGDIKEYILPKSFAHDTHLEEAGFISNFVGKKAKLEKANLLIDAPIEIHLISIIWIIQEGYLLASEITNNYGYELAIAENTNKVVSGKKLFNPYFEKYQLWRDKGIKTAKSIISGGSNTLLIGLDIKSYFPSIDLDFKKVKNSINYQDANNGIAKKELIWTSLLKRIHYAYKTNCNKTNNCLPIGLLSSGVLGNWYLKDFDNSVRDQLSPAYYGRYVDDIFIVLSDVRNPKTTRKGANNILQYVVDRFFKDILFKEGDLVKIAPDIAKNLTISSEKFNIYYFDHNWPLAILNNFEKKLQENSSAFWFLPEEESLEQKFEEKAFDLVYSDSINKFRSVREINQSKYGASVFLAKRIKLAVLAETPVDKENTKQILAFFQGRVALEYWGLWEKVFTLFVVTNDISGITRFLKHCLDQIDVLEIIDETHASVKEDMVVHLKESLALALSLKPKLLLKKALREAVKTNLTIKSIEELLAQFRSSLMVRQHYLLFPFLAYTKYGHNPKNDLVFKDFPFSKIRSEKDLEISDQLNQWCPRFVLWQELSLRQLYIEIVKGKSSGLFDNLAGDSFYNKIHLAHQLLNDLPSPFSETKRKNPNPVETEIIHEVINELNISDKRHLELHRVKVKGESKSKIKIALANLKVDSKNVEAAIQANPVLNRTRRKEFLAILNSASIENVDLLVFQENVFPFSWLFQLSDEARRKKRGIIAGLEHVVNSKGECYNLAVTLLPFSNNGIPDTVIVPRLKNHYSPFERKVIEGNRKTVPVPNPFLYHLFSWRGMQFTLFNCYELADILHRSMIKSEVDVLIAVEFNKDVNYFANIVESVSRDIHCYVVQVNTSDYGDSRITQPKKTEEMNIIQLKGGENPVLLTALLDIKTLREFQSSTVDYQLHKKTFKPTPPLFDHDKPNSRG
jgi:hypothetical protein